MEVKRGFHWIDGKTDKSDPRWEAEKAGAGLEQGLQEPSHFKVPFRHTLLRHVRPNGKALIGYPNKISSNSNIFLLSRT